MPAPRVFLTGFPGFLGSALIERLLARGDGPVACLVQPAYRDLAERRAAAIVEGLESYGREADGSEANELETDGPEADSPEADVDDDSIQLYEGDITEPDLGLGDALEELGSVEELYHLAAVYDLGVDRGLAEAVNVRGTEHVLDVADDLEIDRFQYVSTCYVSGRYDGVFTEDHLEEGQDFNNHYEATKYLAEVAVQDRMAEGLPATIYRPAIVVGDSQRGETDKYDGPYYLLRWLLAQPRWCSLSFSLPGSAETGLNVVPRDFVIDAISHLSGREDTVDEVYQLCDPAPLTVPQFVDALATAAGHRTVTVPTTKSIGRATMERLAARGAPLEPATLDYLDHPTRYAAPNARRALEGSGLECPPFDSYVDRLVAYVLNNPDVGDEAMV